MKAGKLSKTLAAVSVGIAALGMVAVNAAAQVSLPPFYEAASQMIRGRKAWSSNQERRDHDFYSRRTGVAYRLCLFRHRQP